MNDCKAFGKIKPIEMQNNNIREVEMSFEYKRDSFYSHTNISVPISSSGEENRKKGMWQFNSVLLKIEHILKVSGLPLKWKDEHWLTACLNRFRSASGKNDWLFHLQFLMLIKPRGHIWYLRGTMTGSHAGWQKATSCGSNLWMPSSE